MIHPKGRGDFNSPVNLVVRQLLGMEGFVGLRVSNPSKKNFAENFYFFKQMELVKHQPL